MLTSKKSFTASLLCLTLFSAPLVNAETKNTALSASPITNGTKLSQEDIELSIPGEVLTSDSIGTEIRNTIKEKDANEAKVTNIPVSPETVTDFAASPFKLNSATAQVPVETRLRIEVETPLTAEKAIVGEQFKAKVLNDFYLAGDFRKLIIPKNSWIRGKVSQVKRPRLLSRAGKLGIKLDTLVTPLGDYVPLNADLVFMEGIVNAQGLLDPQTGFSDKAMAPTQNLLSTDTGKIVSVATLGVPVIGTLIGGSAIALFSHGDAASVNAGQELQIVLTRNTDLAM